MIRARNYLLALAMVAASAARLDASPYSVLVQSHGPVAYSCLGELSGTTAADTTGAHSGTYQNTYTLGANAAIVDDTDKSATFGGGANDRVQVNAFGISGTGITILGWFKANAFGDDRFVAKATGTSLATAYWSLGTDSSSKLKAQIMIGGTTQELQPSVSMSTDIWYFAAVTYDGSTLRVYLDGVEVGSGSYSGAVTTDSTVAVGLGNLPSGAGNRAFNGTLDELAVFNKALTAAEIATLFSTAGGGMRGRWKLTETSGTTATDTSPQQNNGTYTNGVVLGSSGPYPGPGDKAANFDGINDHVDIPNQAMYDLTGPMAVAAWIKVDVFDDVDQSILTKGKNAWRLQRDGSNNGVSFTCDNLSTDKVATTVDVNDGQWHHIVGVYTGSQLQIYVDGVLNNSVSSTGSIRSNNRVVQIGRNSQNPAAEFDGSIHDARIYSRSVSATEVAQLYGLIGHWQLNQTSGTTATDSSVFARHGTSTGTTSWSTDCSGAGVFDFNGSSLFTVTNAADFQPTTTLSIAAWIKGDSWGSGSSANAILRKGDTNPNNYSLQIADGRVELLLDGNDAAGIRGNTVLTAGQWYHVAATWDGSTVKIYVNGVLDNSPGTARAAPIATDTRPLYLGGRAGADYFDGMIRDVRFYNRPVTAAELAKLSGMVGWWKFAEGTGTSAADSSGLANTATLSGGATWTSDCAGNNNALLTNGTGGIAATNASFTPPDTGSVAFWMRSTGTPVTVARILGNGSDWEIRQNPDGRVITDLSGDGNTTIGTVTPLTQVGRWYHVAFTFDSSTDTYGIYVNGLLEQGGAHPNNLVQQPAGILSFGTRTGSTEYWSGALRDVRVYSRKLCPTEIAALYGLVGHWKLDESSGTVAADSTGFGNHGTYSGSPTIGVPAATGLGANFPTNGTLLTVPASASLNSIGVSNENFSAAFWVKPGTAPGDWRPLFHKGSVNFERGPGLWLNPGNTRVHFRVSTTANNNEGTDSVANLTTGAWSHVACVKAGNKWRLYIGGLLDTEFTLTGTTTGNSGPLYLGDDPWYAGSNVSLDDVRIYNRALCPTEIQELEAGGNPFSGVKIIKWVEIQ